MQRNRLQNGDINRLQEWLGADLVTSIYFCKVIKKYRPKSYSVKAVENMNNLKKHLYALYIQ